MGLGRNSEEIIRKLVVFPQRDSVKLEKCKGLTIPLCSTASLCQKQVELLSLLTCFKESKTNPAHQRVVERHLLSLYLLSLSLPSCVSSVTTSASSAALSHRAVGVSFVLLPPQLHCSSQSLSSPSCSHDAPVMTRRH